MHVLVVNNSGGSVTEKVQGGLTGVKGATYSVVSVSATCGGAAFKAGGSGNVVVWNASGNGNTASPGFTIAAGKICELEVQINNASFGSTGLQTITSDWTETQTGPGNFSGQSPTAGPLKVNVVA